MTLAPASVAAEALVDLFAGSLQFAGLLGRVRMIWTGIELQLFQHRVSQLVLWQHATNRVIQQIFRLAVLAIRVAFQSQSGVPGVPGVVPHVHFSARHRDLVDVGDDHEVAAINMRRVLWPMLAHQNDGDVTG